MSKRRKETFYMLNGSLFLEEDVLPYLEDMLSRGRYPEPYTVREFRKVSLAEAVAEDLDLPRAPRALSADWLGHAWHVEGDVFVTDADSDDKVYVVRRHNVDGGYEFDDLFESDDLYEATNWLASKYPRSRRRRP